MKIYTAQQAAKIKQIDDSHIRRLISQGKIHAVKFGRGWLITEDDLKDYYPMRRKRVSKDKEERREYPRKIPTVPEPVKSPEKITEKFFLDEEN